jgi:DedD protein
VAGTSEPSYYEVALTSKQVMAALVIVLACLTAAFFAGFWIGRDSERPLVLASQELHQPSPIERPPEEPLPVTPGTEGVPVLEPVTEPVAEGLGAEPVAEATAEPEAAPAPTGAGGFEAPPALPPPNGVVNPDPNVPLWKQRLDRAREAARLEKEFAQATGEPAANGAAPPAAASPQPAPIVAETTRPAEPAPSVPAPSVAVSEPAPARPAGAGAESVYVVQILVTKDPAKARQVIAQLKGAGYPASLATFEQGGATLSRVKVGPYRERARAQAIGNEIKTKLKLEAWVRAEAP